MYTSGLEKDLIPSYDRQDESSKNDRMSAGWMKRVLGAVSLVIATIILFVFLNFDLSCHPINLSETRKAIVKRSGGSQSFVYNVDPSFYNILTVYSQLDANINVYFNHSDVNNVIQFNSNITQSNSLDDSLIIVPRLSKNNNTNGATLFLESADGKTTTGFNSTGSTVDVTISVPCSVKLLKSLIVYIVNGQFENLSSTNSTTGLVINNLSITGDTINVSAGGIVSKRVTITSNKSAIEGSLSAGQSIDLVTISSTINPKINHIDNIPPNQYDLFTTETFSVSAKSRTGNINLSLVSSNLAGNYSATSLNGKFGATVLPSFNLPLTTNWAQYGVSGQFGSFPVTAARMSTVTVNNNFGDSFISFV
ncbi:hypothetical protein AYI68_g3522 [Smittium mucronatum]|uniref:Adhesin domain-containing protein n=1 Tax=Smittium mucronatum TaxID=133383 RepID=A0A1R0GZM5_9FUNG|nr:hypothetical protein AYI68_g3522 [Smittium mucronatum]